MENRREKRKIILKRKGMLIAVITLLICIFSNTSLAGYREEIEEHEVLSTRIALKQGLNLQRNAIMLYNSTLSDFGVDSLEEIANLSRVKTIDLTGVNNGSEGILHEHIYTSKYDETQHWKECYICHEKIDIHAHNMAESSPYANNDCSASRPARKMYCADGCGYYYDMPKKEHRLTFGIWGDRFCHGNYQCVDCGEGQLYAPPHESRCRNQYGQVLGCDTGIFGTCAICGTNYTAQHGVIVADESRPRRRILFSMWTTNV